MTTDIGEFAIRQFVHLFLELSDLLIPEKKHFHQLYLPILYWLKQNSDLQNHLFGHFPLLLKKVSEHKESFAKKVEELTTKIEPEKKEELEKSMWKMLPEDLTFIGFLPLDLFLLSQKTSLLEKVVPENEQSTRILIISHLLNSLEMQKHVILDNLVY